MDDRHEKALDYGFKLIAEAIQAHFGDRVEDYDEDVDDTANHDAWEAFDAGRRAALPEPARAGEAVALECASEDCDKPSAVYFEGGGVGAHFCHDCYQRVQSLAAPAPTVSAGVEVKALALALDEVYDDNLGWEEIAAAAIRALARAKP